MLIGSGLLALHCRLPADSPEITLFALRFHGIQLPSRSLLLYRAAAERRRLPPPPWCPRRCARSLAGPSGVEAANRVGQVVARC